MPSKDYSSPLLTPLLDERQKAAELNCSLSFLRKDRLREEPFIPFVKIGRLVRYYPFQQCRDEI